MEVIYEDNHLIVVNKAPGEIVQGDKTNDQPLSELVAVYLKEKYHKPGNVFVGVVHRLDRPVGGLVLFAKTSKALGRMNNLFREGKVRKRYLAIVANPPQPTQGRLVNWLKKNEKLNKSFVVDKGSEGSKRAELVYRTVARSERYTLVEVELLTGRHHQIRCQFSALGCPLKGDLKYGAPRPNRDASISLISYRMDFEHPVSKQMISLVAPIPKDPLWQAFVPQLETFV
jgi:hypothetical protein